MQTSSYQVLLRQPYFARLVGAGFLARLGGSMWSVAIVLFVLERYHSPTLAGLTVLVSLAPGLVISPLAGAALDRWGRVPMIIADYAVAVLTVGALLGLDWSGRLSVAWLIALMFVSSLPVPLGMAGARSLFPMLAPRHLWERANALDSALYSLSNIVGPALAGVLVALWGGEGALAVIAVVWVAAIVVIAGVRVPPVVISSPSVLTDAWIGLREVFRNPALRAITLSVPIQNAGRGVFLLAIPVFVLRELHEGPQVVGWLLSANAATALCSGIVCGRLRTEGRERGFMLTSLLVSGAALVAMSAMPNLVLALACMALVGLPAGLFDIPMFSLRQRVVDTGILGRVLAVSMSFNFLGNPVGSGLGGPVVSISPRLGFVVAGVLTGLAAGALALMLPRVNASAAAGELATRPAPEVLVESGV